MDLRTYHPIASLPCFGGERGHDRSVEVEHLRTRKLSFSKCVEPEHLAIEASPSGMGDGKLRKTIFTDVFAYRAGRWQAVNAQELPFEESARR